MQQNWSKLFLFEKSVEISKNNRSGSTKLATGSKELKAYW